jgi:23S rRNA maturation-related 3'-5' exoribonuclease YhaM
MYFEEINVGTNANLELLIKGVQEMMAKNGQPYQSLTCSDLSGTIKKVNCFQQKLQLNLEKVKFPITISANVRADLYLGNKTFLMNDYKKSSLKVEEFYPKSEIDFKKVWNEIIALIKTIKDEALCKFICQVLNNNKEAFKTMPLDNIVFNRTNGILEATQKLMKIADAICNEIKFLDRDIMLSGASIFYIGQIYATDAEMNYTDKDVLLGPGLLSLEEIIKVEQKFKEPISNEKITLLKHLVVSRNRGHYAATPEAITLYYLDTILQETEEANGIISTLGETGYCDRYIRHRSRLYKMPKDEKN